MINFRGPNYGFYFAMLKIHVDKNRICSVFNRKLSVQRANLLMDTVAFDVSDKEVKTLNTVTGYSMILYFQESIPRYSLLAVLC